MSADGTGLTPERLAHDLAEGAKIYDVVVSTPTTLLLDLDTVASRAQFQRVFPRVRELFGVIGSDQWRSKSGNSHVVITLAEPQPPAVRLALQAALGSDGVREVLGVKRLLNGCPEPSALFRPREKIVETVETDLCGP